MSSECQRIEIRKIPHTHVSSDITDFTPAVTAIVIGMEKSDAFNTWAQTFSANYESTYNTVSSNSADWESSYNTVNSYSALWATAVGEYLPLSGGTVTGQTNIQNVLSSNNVIYAFGGNSNLWNLSYNSVNSASAKWDDTSSKVQTNSAYWNPSGNYFLPLSGGTVTGRTNIQNILSSNNVIYASGGNSNLWNAVYNSVNSASAKWDDTSSKVQSNSASWNPSGLYFLPLSGGTVTGQTNVQNVLSSNNVIYANSGNSNLWSSSYTTVNSYSAKWDDTSSKVQTNSAYWNPSGLYFLPLSGGTVIGQTNVQNVLSSNNIIYANSGNSNLWSSVYNSVNTASAKWDDTSSKVQTNSASWTPSGNYFLPLSGGTATGKITVQNVLSSTNVIYASGGNSNLWNAVYNSVNSASAKWDDTSSKVQTNSASWNPSGIYFLPLSGGTVTGQTNVQNVLSSNNVIYANSGNSNLWSSSYTTVNSYSGGWATAVGAYLPLSGGTVTGQTNVQNVLSSNNVIYANSGNSNLWSSTYTTVNSYSGGWGGSTIGTGLYLPLSGGTVTGQTNVQNVLSSNNVIYANSGNSNLWSSTYTTVNSYSGGWGVGTVGTGAYLPLSGGTVTGQTNVQNVLSSNNVIYANSGNSNLWSSSYTTVNSYSGGWGGSTIGTGLYLPLSGGTVTGPLNLIPGGSPNGMFVYNTYTNPTNFERGYLNWGSTIFRIGTDKGTTGSVRSIDFQTDGTTRMSVAATGEVNVVGHFSAATKSFLIPHPTKFDKKLQYACLEGPENGVYVRGKTDENVIYLPEYWKVLVDEESITTTLTPINKHQQLYVESQDSTSIKIGNVTGFYNYVIFGERKDVNKLQTEI